MLFTVLVTDSEGIIIVNFKVERPGNMAKPLGDYSFRSSTGLGDSPIARG